MCAYICDISMRQVTYEIVYLIEKLIQFLAVDEADVTLAQQSAHFPLQFVLVDIQHYQDSDEIVQQSAQQPVLLVLQPPPFALA